MRRGLLLLAAALALPGCASPLTTQRLTPSFTETFAGLYARQQQLLGLDALERLPANPVATCRRTGPDAKGAGEDWFCSVHFVDRLTPVTQRYEVQVKPDGCWKAEGPPAAQPAELVDGVTGVRLTNPLAEFDGCFDTSWG